ncbi:CAAX prenyl protease-like protein [Roseivirga pacifica]|uniref:CAAX protease self-immunity n=1 Tax=Roseivirga pacifica TaxID=1267423 RepID=A0A1I0MCP6_9BACT|nr:CPBP family intramembrane glutamic endopeptidase [Roseivirga pacifica]RKQ50282.1 CAAX prenyl protease-like protein [Roseivirga pacifica]SEV86062.1 CAAX protease self-immunity [Roseivirga pacifica]
MNIPPWTSEYLEPALAIALVTIGFSVYHFVSISEKVKANFARKYGEVRGNTKAQWFYRYLGCMTIGVIPAILMMLILDKSPAEYGVAFKNHATSLYWIFGLALIIIPMNFFNSKKPKNLAFYPNVREKEWTKKMVAHNAFTWMSYLFGYELMFRGLLLFATVPLMGEWPAIILNAAIYALVHVPKNLEETIGAVPLGIVLCLVTLTTGTIWVAFFVHITLALSNFFFSLKHHPDMKVI